MAKRGRKSRAELAQELIEQRVKEQEEQDKKGFDRELKDYEIVERLPKWKDGETRTLRVLPAVDAFKYYLEHDEEDAVFEDEAFPVQEIGDHYNVGPKKQKVSCLKFWGDDSCPVCEEIAELYATKDEDDEQYAKDMRLSKAFVRFVVWREWQEDNPNEPIKVWAWQCSKTVDTDVVKLYSNTKIPDPDALYDGTDIEVTRHGTTMKGTSYDIDDVREESFAFTTEDGEFDYETAEKVCEMLPDIFKWSKPFLTYEETESVLKGETVKAVMSARYANEVIDDGEESEDEPPFDIPEEEDEKERPRRSSRGRSSKSSESEKRTSRGRGRK
jgi:hypothetical protein